MLVRQARRDKCLLSRLKPGDVFMREHNVFTYMKTSEPHRVVELDTGHVREWKTDCEVEFVRGAFEEEVL